MHIYEFGKISSKRGAFSCCCCCSTVVWQRTKAPSYSPFHPPSFCAKVQLRCREKMRPKMYFLRASHKSPQMFLAGYFIGASDRWSWWKKKMVLSQLSSSSSPLLLATTYFRDVPCGRRSLPRRTTRQRHHPQLRSKLSYLAIYDEQASKPMHMDDDHEKYTLHCL